MAEDRPKLKLTEIEIAAQTMTGDLRDAAMTWIKALTKPYAQLSEDGQKLVIESVTKSAEELVDKAVKIIAAGQHEPIDSTLDSISVKGGLKVVLKCQKSEAALCELGMAEGARVLLIVADGLRYRGERRPMLPTPAQGTIPGTPTQQ